MSKLNQIQQELKAIDQARFQKLGDSYLMQQPRYGNLKSIGSVMGADKVRTGIPDSLILLPDGGYAFVHYTTQEKNLPRKLSNDFDDSFDEDKTHILGNEVREVILIHNGALGQGDELSLIKRGSQKNSTVRVIGLERLAHDLYQKYPGLAEEFLGIKVDTRQILNQVDFVSQYNKGSFSTPLDTIFHFREKELGLAISYLEAADLLLITGGAGVGKSRLMLEIASRFSGEDMSFTTWCIFRRGPDLFEDLRSYFSKPGKYLILVDDANRLSSNLDYILQFLHEQTPYRQVKVIVTVRDYAREKVAEQATKYGGGPEIHLRAFEDEQIRALVSAEAGVGHPIYLKRISDLSQGNPRLAMMAAKIAVDNNTLASISDVTTLYEEYFRSIREDLVGLDGRDAIKVAGIVSFFRVVDCSNKREMEEIEQAFGVQSSVFRRVVEQLHDLEILDLYENEVAKFSDQILATYLFYLAVFRERVVDFSILLDRFFPRHKPLFIDALNPVINALGARIEQELKPHVEAKWEQLRELGDQNALEELILTFWFVNPTKTLLEIRDLINKITPEQVNINVMDFTKVTEGRNQDFPLLPLLGSFYQPHFSAALGLVLEAFERAPQSLLGTTFGILVKDFGYKFYSQSFNLDYLQEVVDQLWLRAGKGDSLLFSRLFIGFAGYCLRTEYQFTESKGRMAISINTLKLHATPELCSLRCLMLSRTLDLFALEILRSDVLQLLYKYCHSGYEVSGSGIIKSDSEVILPFILNNLDPDNYSHVDIVQSYLGFLRRESVEYDQGIRDRFTNPTSLLADILLVDRHIRTGMSWQDGESWQDEQIREWLKGGRLEDYEQFFRQSLTITTETRKPEPWQFGHSMGKVFSMLLEEESKLFLSVISLYLDMGNPFQIVDRRLISRLIQVTGGDEAYRIISGKQFKKKIQWLFQYFASVPADQVKSELLDQLYDLYRSTPANEIYLDLESLERYLQIDSRFILRVVELLLSRMQSDEEQKAGFQLSLMFYLHQLTTEKAHTYFGMENIDVLKRAYIAGDAVEDHADYDGRVFNVLLDLDRSFLREYIDDFVGRAVNNNERWLSRYDHKREYDFLWRRDDYLEFIPPLVKHLFELQRSGAIYLNDFPSHIFAVKINRESPDELVIERRLGVLRSLIEGYANDVSFMHFLFSITVEFAEEELRSLVAFFLERNKRVEDFRQVPLSSASGGYIGSAVPMLQKQVNFLESLLPLAQGIELLEHRFYIEKRIEGFQRAIEEEKRRNFLMD